MGVVLRNLQTKILYFRYRELIFLLQQQNKDIYLVSGGFHSIIRPIADKLKIDHGNIIANKLMFDSSGEEETHFL